MRNFKKILLRVLLILCFLAGFNAVVRFMYESMNTNSIYTKRDLRETEGEIETLVLGTSLAHWGIDTHVLEEIIDSPSFNLATSAQPLEGSYYLLKDQVKRNPLKQVFLGIHVTSVINEWEDLPVRQGIYDRILSPVGKMEYLLKTAGWQEFEQYLFYSARVPNKLQRRAVTKNLKYKCSKDYWDNIPPEGQKLEYLGMGNENTELVYDGSFQDEALKADAVWNRDQIKESNEVSMKKIAELCKKEGIELNLVVMPMTWEFTRLMGDLEDFHAYLEDFCDENGANLYDFHTYEGVYDGMFENADYQDKKHFNKTGAKKFTEILGEWYMKEGTE